MNILVLDTEVYSNTGGQMSKSTPVGAIAKFAAGGKPLGKKDLGMMAIAYGNVYVAKIAFGANRLQTVRAFNEADAYDGPSIIIAYSHCINHGLDLRKGISQQKLAVESGHWPLFRYNPALRAEGKNPLTLDSKEPTADIAEYMYNETRFRALKQIDSRTRGRRCSSRRAGTRRSATRSTSTSPIGPSMPPRLPEERHDEEDRPCAGAGPGRHGRGLGGHQHRRGVPLLHAGPGLQRAALAARLADAVPARARRFAPGPSFSVTGDWWLKAGAISGSPLGYYVAVGAFVTLPDLTLGARVPIGLQLWLLGDLLELFLEAVPYAGLYLPAMGPMYGIGVGAGFRFWL